MCLTPEKAKFPFLSFLFICPHCIFQNFNKVIHKQTKRNSHAFISPVYFQVLKHDKSTFASYHGENWITVIFRKMGTFPKFIFYYDMIVISWLGGHKVSEKKLSLHAWKSWNFLKVNERTSYLKLKFKNDI